MLVSLTLILFFENTCTSVKLLFYIIYAGVKSINFLSLFETEEKLPERSEGVPRSGAGFSVVEKWLKKFAAGGYPCRLLYSDGDRLPNDACGRV